MIMKAISEPCTCIHIVVVKCTFCSCTYTDNLMVTQRICIHVHVSDYGYKMCLWVMCMFKTFKSN